MTLPVMESLPEQEKRTVGVPQDRHKNRCKGLRARKSVQGRFGGTVVVSCHLAVSHNWPRHIPFVRCVLFVSFTYHCVYHVSHQNVFRQSSTPWERRVLWPGARARGRGAVGGWVLVPLPRSLGWYLCGPSEIKRLKYFASVPGT